MRCSKCGGILHHWLRTVDDRSIYRCHTGMTGFESDGSRNTRIYPCDTTYDEKHTELPTGTLLAYTSGKRYQTLVV